MNNLIDYLKKESEKQVSFGKTQLVVIDWIFKKMKEFEHQIAKIGIEAFILKDGKLLLGMRKNAVGAGEWGLPGGHLQTGETNLECLKRELMEETGLEVKNAKLVAVDNNPQNAGGHRRPRRWRSGPRDRA